MHDTLPGSEEESLLEVPRGIGRALLVQPDRPEFTVQGSARGTRCRLAESGDRFGKQARGSLQVPGSALGPGPLDHGERVPSKRRRRREDDQNGLDCPTEQGAQVASIVHPHASRPRCLGIMQERDGPA